VSRIESLAATPDRIPGAVAEFLTSLRQAIDEVDAHVS
jgi:tryptophan synthase alpha chain